MVPIFMVVSLTACSKPTYACTDPLGCLEIPPGNPVSIGVIYANAGGAAPLGLDSLDKLEQAINKQGTILGHEIDLHRQATDCTPESAREAALELAIIHDFVSVIGPTCLSESFISNPILLDAGFTILSPYRPDSHGSIDLLFEAIKKVAVRGSDGTLYIPRLALRKALDLPARYP